MPVDSPARPVGSPVRIVRFSIFEVNLHTGELRKQGQKLRLQEQPFQVLAALLERPGEIVTREELRSKLWPADTFVDFDHSLNAAIKRLRDALGESAETPVFIETLARRGYRFIGPVEMPIATPSAQPRHRMFNTRNSVLGGLAVCAIALSVLYYARWVRPSPLGVTPTVILAVTTVGPKFTPSLSPDAQHLAFAWNGGAGEHFSLYVKVVGTEEALRLTNQESIDFNPIWSPDGRYIAFCRFGKAEKGIYIIPALGGAERRVRVTSWGEHFFEGRLSWSPDGKLLAFSDRVSPEERRLAIFLLSLDSLEVRRLTSPQLSRSDTYPAFSPDGQTLAFIRNPEGVYTVPVSGGKEQYVVSGAAFEEKEGLAWTPDGRDVVYPAGGWLWKRSLRGGEPERLQVGQDGGQPSIRGSKLVYLRQAPNINVWRRRLNSSVSAGAADRFISSTRIESGPQFSPDGTKIAFESTRSGAYEIWTCQSNGNGLLQLTHFNSPTGTPRWSPDGQQIAFASLSAGIADIFVIDSRGGAPRKLTSDSSNDVVPSWSRDGQWIYFVSNRSGSGQIWKMRFTGGPALQVTHGGGFAAFESLDGKYLYYAKGPAISGLWRVPTSGGEEAEVIGSLEAGYWGYWAVVEDGIYYLDSTTKPGIAFFEFATGRTTRIFGLENPAKGMPGLAIAPDKKTILYAQQDSLSSDIILVENFR